ncbi:MAG: hemerythrin domain-containing protein [Pseudomonadota bacterium]
MAAPRPELPLDWSLERRTGLPDALRVLLKEYPKEGWERDPGFSGLLRFWLDRHIMFRELSERLVAEVRTFLDDQGEVEQLKANISRFGGLFVNELHGHHHIEDAHYFPMLVQHDARLVRGFALLDADHHAIDPQLSIIVDAANGVLRSDGAGLRDATAALQTVLERFDGLLNRHLQDEEELCVPVVLRYGEQGVG